MRRALLAVAAGIVLTLSVLAAAGLVSWARQPTTDPLGRACGGGIFSPTAPKPDDDSFMDGCEYVRQGRERDIQALAIPTAVALLASLGCVVFLATERRRVFV